MINIHAHAPQAIANDATATVVKRSMVVKGRHCWMGMGAVGESRAWGGLPGTGGNGNGNGGDGDGDSSSASVGCTAAAMLPLTLSSSAPQGDGRTAEKAAATEARGAAETETAAEAGENAVLMAAEVRIRETFATNTCPDLRIALLGEAQSGKSTLLGVLAHDELDDGHGKARLQLFR